MNRRQAIGLGIAVAVGIPAGILYWNKSKLKTTHIFDEDRSRTLSSAVDAIIPETDIPGAKSLEVDAFIATMIQDCYDEETQASFKKGLKSLNQKAKSKFTNAFYLIKPGEQLKVLQAFPEDDPFIRLLRNLTIQGYNTSEYVMTQIKDYEFIPGRYIGCVDIKPKTNA